MQDVVKNTPSEHPDYKNLCDAVAAISGVADDIDQKMNEIEQVRRKERRSKSDPFFSFCICVLDKEDSGASAKDYRRVRDARRSQAMLSAKSEFALSFLSSCFDEFCC